MENDGFDFIYCSFQYDVIKAKYFYLLVCVFIIVIITNNYYGVLQVLSNAQLQKLQLFGSFTSSPPQLHFTLYGVSQRRRLF